MSTVAPVVRHMLLCREVRRDPNPPHSIDLLGLVMGIRAGPSASYPLRLPDLSVFAELTGRYGEGTMQVTVREADTDTLVYSGPEHTLPASSNPLTVRVVTIRTRDCTLPNAGLYWVQLCYNNEVIAEEPFTAR
jgi:hypothetical protein